MAILATLLVNTTVVHNYNNTILLKNIATSRPSTVGEICYHN